MRHLRYIPFPRLRRLYRRRRERIGIVKETMAMLPLVAAIVVWLLF